ncbi:MAG: hypothetical protein H5T50_07195 [Nitrososphaeria archaeon]|nr:hypothetical protein [Nitrososphaeria archaeon]
MQENFCLHKFLSRFRLALLSNIIIISCDTILKSVFDEILCLITLTLILSPLTAFSIFTCENKLNSFQIELFGYLNSGKGTIIFLKNNSPLKYSFSKLIVNDIEYSLPEQFYLKPYELTTISLPATLSQIYHLTLVCDGTENVRVI